MPHLTTELEEIFTGEERSISLMVNPDLSDFFFWHFHPEFELVYIDGANGTRHVGEHISSYSGSDLVMIGSNIPHLNFDYGVKTRYEKRVIHFRQEFPDWALHKLPEFTAMDDLFSESMYGICFGAKTQTKIKPLIMDLHKKSPFEQMLTVYELLHVLSVSTDRERLHNNPYIPLNSPRDHDRLKKIFSFVESNYMTKINNQDAAAHCNLSYEAFCRYFKKMTLLTFTEFVNQYRIDKSKKLLLQGGNVTEACYECGFESLSYFNRVFKKMTGENPTAFRKRHQ
jgi:AraC-like DNA-binding protein